MNSHESASQDGIPDTVPDSPAAHARLGGGAMFDRIAHRYDMVNRVISLGVDQGWRRRTVAAMNLEGAQRVLDIATGTADLALRIAKDYPNVLVDGLDPSDGMLAIGERKAHGMELSERVHLVHGDAEALPFPDDTFDGVCIAFGIRNVPDRAKALREMARVTRPGGRVAILELSEPAGGVMAPMARFHIHTVVPRLGALLSGAQEYRYLQESIAAFPSPEDFGKLMEANGLKVLEIAPLTFGVCCLYVAEPA